MGDRNTILFLIMNSNHVLGNLIKFCHILRFTGHFTCQTSPMGDTMGAWGEADIFMPFRKSRPLLIVEGTPGAGYPALWQVIPVGAGFINGLHTAKIMSGFDPLLS